MKNKALVKNMKHVKWNAIPPLKGPDPRGLIKETKQESLLRRILKLQKTKMDRLMLILILVACRKNLAAITMRT